jgi:hypothetical protein
MPRGKRRLLRKKKMPPTTTTKPKLPSNKGAETMPFGNLASETFTPPALPSGGDVRSLAVALINELQGKIAQLEQIAGIASGDDDIATHVQMHQAPIYITAPSKGAPKVLTVADFIYEVLKSASEPLKASEVHRRVLPILPTGKPKPSYQTVYNALRRGEKLFVAKGEKWTLKR